LWINTSGSLVQINPVSGVVRRTIPRDVRDLASDGRALWTSTNGADVLRIDPQTGAVTTVTLPVDSQFAIALAADPATGAVWAASSPRPVGTGGQRLLRLPPYFGP
jgi:DNA-binding beta-propeller fold protein YncE